MKDEIEIYWWNFGKKTFDFAGNYEDFFKKKDIKIEEHKNKYEFEIPLSNCNVKFTINSNHKDSCKEAVKIFLTILGDKHLFIDHANREHRLNW